MFHERQELTEAEGWWRSAAEAGHVGAMTNLGVLLYDRQALTEAEKCWRSAAATGDRYAVSNLAGLLKEQGRPPQEE